MLNTGSKYIDACRVTRSTFRAYTEVLLERDLEGFSDYEVQRTFNKSQQGAPRAKMLAAQAQVLSPSPQRQAAASGSRGRSRSPSTAGPAPAPPQPKSMPVPTVDPVTGAQFYKLSDMASSKNSDGAREKWSDSADSSRGASDDHGAFSHLKTNVDAARLADRRASQRSAISSAASAASSTRAEWNMVDAPPRPKRKGALEASHTSKASRSSTNVSRASAFLRKPPQEGP